MTSNCWKRKESSTTPCLAEPSLSPPPFSLVDAAAAQPPPTSSPLPSVQGADLCASAAGCLTMCFLQRASTPLAIWMTRCRRNNEPAVALLGCTRHLRCRNRRHHLLRWRRCPGMKHSKIQIKVTLLLTYTVEYVVCDARRKRMKKITS